MTEKLVFAYKCAYATAIECFAGIAASQQQKCIRDLLEKWGRFAKYSLVIRLNQGLQAITVVGFPVAGLNQKQKNV